MDNREKISEEAFTWVLKLHSSMPAEYEEFIAWLRAAPEHMDELLMAMDTLQALREISPPSRMRPASRTSAGIHWRKLSSYLAAACLAVAMVSAVVFALNFRSVETLKTAYEWKTQVLSDGTVVQMGPRTELFIRYSSDKRAIDLVSGEAMFEVAKNPQRPFIVTAGVATARAVGTRFAASVESVDESLITVEEGVVAVKRLGGSVEPSVTLNASYEVRVTRGRELVPHRVDLDAALAWTRHRLVVDQQTIRDIVRQFNRFNRVQLVLQDDPALAQIMIAAKFPADHPEEFVRFLEKLGIASAEVRESQIILSTPRL